MDILEIQILESLGNPNIRMEIVEIPSFENL